jgi:hypothetical protein
VTLVSPPVGRDPVISPPVGRDPVISTHVPGFPGEIP